jgi:hypothetical protein
MPDQDELAEERGEAVITFTLWRINIELPRILLHHCCSSVEERDDIGCGEGL